MPQVLILDTCVLPQRGSIHSNPLLSALLRVSMLSGVRVCITDITLAESLNKRKTLAQKAIDGLGAAIRDTAKVLDVEGFDYYIPSADDAVEEWRTELTESLEVIKTSGDDALEALHREASRVAPARSTDAGSAVGGRDSAIWLTVKRGHLENPGQKTYFVSSNVSDFASKGGEVQLRGELREELGGTIERFIYFTSVQRVVGYLAPEGEVKDLTFSDLQGLISETNVEDQLLVIAQVAVRDRDLPQPISLSVNGVKERRVYQVQDVRLSQMDIEFGCLSDPANDELPPPSSPVPGKASAWLYRSQGDVTFEFEALTFADVQLKIR
ncbi:PIN domain-containing protein [Saccharothrix isguenensis]